MNAQVASERAYEWVRLHGPDEQPLAQSLGDPLRMALHALLSDEAQVWSPRSTACCTSSRLTAPP
jgi:hypothetical protein